MEALPRKTRPIPLGDLVATPGAPSLLERCHINPLSLVTPIHRWYHRLNA